MTAAEPAVELDSRGRKKAGGRPRDPLLAGRIIEAVTGLVADRGPFGFSVDDVAARLGAGKATIYRRWTSLDALFVDLVRGLGPREQDVVLDEPGSIREDLIALLSAATIGTRARAEAALIPVLRYRPDLRQAWQAGPARRLTAALLTTRERARDRGDIAEAPSGSRVHAAISLLRHDAAVLGRDPDRVDVQAVVDLLLLRPRVATPDERAAADELTELSQDLGLYDDRPARDDDYTPAAINRAED